MSFKKILIYILIAGTLIATIAGLWFWQSNQYSKGSLKLEIIGPDQAELAQEVEYIVKYKNNGNTRLENPKLIFQFPEHSLTEKQREEIELDEIYPGQEATKKFKARILGTEGQAKVAKAWLNYRPKNLNASFESKTTQTTIIEKVPLTFNFDLPSTVEPNTDFKFDLNYFSNVDYPLSDLRVRVDYPSGFEFKESKPEGLAEDKWEVGLLNKAQGGKIEIEGKLEGKIGENKIFEGQLGVWQGGEFVALKKGNRGVQLDESSLYISQEINGSPEYVASPGETLHYEIYFKNIGQQSFTDLFLASTLSGEGFDYDSLKTTRGQFKKGDNSVIFDSRNIPSLRFLEAGQEGKVEFWVDVKDQWEVGQGDPTLTNQVALSQAREEFETKVNAGLSLDQEVYFNNEVFSSSGPIPPEVGEPTTYLVMWKPSKKFNEVDNVKVKSVLPEQVEPTGEIFPEEETSEFAFDSASREVTWNVGEMATSSSNLSFQVELTPESSQLGSPAEIIEQAVITGTDSFTEQRLSATSSAVNTTLPDDDNVSREDGVVQ